MLNQKIRARIRIKFRKKSQLVDMLTLFDPSKKFEETKFANFRSSSKLEGIEIHNSVKELTLDEIVAKHKKAS